jgi:hypothetical protein
MNPLAAASDSWGWPKCENQVKLAQIKWKEPQRLSFSPGKAHPKSNKNQGIYFKSTYSFSLIIINILF